MKTMAELLLSALVYSCLLVSLAQTQGEMNYA